MAPELTAEATEALDEAPAGQAKRQDGQARREGRHLVGTSRDSDMMSI